MASFESVPAKNKAEINEKSFLHEETIKYDKWPMVGDEVGSPIYADGLYTSVLAKGQHNSEQTSCLLVKDRKIIDAVSIKADYPASFGEKSETIWVTRINKEETLRNVQSGSWKIAYEKIGR